jgi:transcription elongation factor GreB
VLEVVKEPPRDRGRVAFGAWVTLEDEDGTEVRYQIVGPDEFDAPSGRISLDSPVARALIGKRDGDEVTVRRPKGDITYTIVDVAYDPPVTAGGGA